MFGKLSFYPHKVKRKSGLMILLASGPGAALRRPVEGSHPRYSAGHGSSGLLPPVSGGGPQQKSRYANKQLAQHLHKRYDRCVAVQFLRYLTFSQPQTDSKLKFCLRDNTVISCLSRVVVDQAR